MTKAKAGRKPKTKPKSSRSRKSSFPGPGEGPAHRAMTVRRMALADLKPAPYNPRRMDDAAFEGLRASLRRFGLVEPIVWNERTGRMVGGHQRHKALLAEGVAECDVVVVDVDETDEKAMNVTLNSPLVAGEFTSDLDSLLRDLQGPLEQQAVTELRLDTLLAKFGLPPELGEAAPPRLDKKAEVVCPECGCVFES